MPQMAHAIPIRPEKMPRKYFRKEKTKIKEIQFVGFTIISDYIFIYVIKITLIFIYKIL